MRAVISALASLIGVCVAQSPPYQRLDVSFDFGWRHRLGTVAPPGPAPPPMPPAGCSAGSKYAFHNASGVRCDGLGKDGDADNAASCLQHCCDDNACAIWQWKDAAISGGGCWRGGSDSCVNDTTWEGGMRTAPIPPTPPPAPLPANPPEATAGYDDSSWELVNAPHDALISIPVSNEECPNGCSGRSYVPRSTSWYRKHFTLPSSWKGSAVWLYFEGTFRETTVWLNGKNVSSHISGYTSYAIRLDDQASLRYGDGPDDQNVLALFIDPDQGRSGWWYEGSGLYRHVRLVRADPVHVAPDGLFAYANLSSIQGGQSATDLTAAAVLHASAEVVNTGGADAGAVAVRFSLFDRSNGTLVASATSTAAPVNAGINAVKLSASINAGTVKLWQIRNPVLYTLQAEVLSGESGSVLLDSINTSTGFRSLRFEPDTGMWMNEQHTKVRGFCDHNDFGSFGMAVPDRIKLFRAQASRSVGGNGRRTSHNAPDPVMLDIYDRLGITVMDENRVIANDTEHENEMRALVARDRNHPAVTIWSFCNEAGCESSANQAGGPRFQRATYELDGSRPTLANMFTFNDLLSNTIDVQGFSHQSRQKIDQCHQAMPDKPIFMSECCSCNTMRGEDNSGGGLQRSFNADCQQGQTNASNGVDYVVGTMVWTLFDYYGEPSNDGWPFVSSSFGAFDLTGFAKAGSYWFRSQWLYGVADDSPDKTFATAPLTDGGRSMVHIVEGWEAPTPAPPTPSMNKTYGVACQNGAMGQVMHFSGSQDGKTPGTVTNRDGLCLDTTCDAKDVEGNGCYPLTFGDCATVGQRAQLVRDASRPGVLKSVSNGGCLDLYGNAIGKVGIYKCSGADNQKWVQDGQALKCGVDGACLSDTSAGGGDSSIRSVHVYTSEPFAELLVNGKSLGVQPVTTAILAGNGERSWAQFDDITFEEGNLTALARSSNTSDGLTLATHTVHTSTATPSKLVLTLDCPSPRTGTGEALLLDGQDAGLVRAAIVDANGVLVRNAATNVSFRVVTGPGRVVGVHSGEQQSHEPTNGVPYHTAYHGLVRAAIMVTSDSARKHDNFDAIDIDHALSAPSSAAPIVLEASAPGLPSTQITIPTSTDASTHSVLAVAERYGTAPVLGFD